MPKIWNHLLSDRWTYDARVDLRAHRSFKAGFSFRCVANFLVAPAIFRSPVADSNPCPPNHLKFPILGLLSKLDFQGSDLPFGLIVLCRRVA